MFSQSAKKLILVLLERNGLSNADIASINMSGLNRLNFSDLSQFIKLFQKLLRLFNEAVTCDIRLELLKNIFLDVPHYQLQIEEAVEVAKECESDFAAYCDVMVKLEEDLQCIRTSIAALEEANKAFKNKPAAFHAEKKLKLAQVDEIIAMQERLRSEFEEPHAKENQPKNVDFVATVATSNVVSTGGVMKRTFSALDLTCVGVGRQFCIFTKENTDWENKRNFQRSQTMKEPMKREALTNNTPTQFKG